MTRSQVGAFLVAADVLGPRLAPLFLLMARTGLRLGEALALQWTDLDFQGRTLRVARNLSGGQVGTPKSGAGRDVDVSRCSRADSGGLPGPEDRSPPARLVRDATLDLLHAHRAPLPPRVIQRAFARVLTKAKLPEHFTPHCLRHTFASILISEGESLAYVQRMLGHTSIKLTVDLYGSWLRWPDGGRIGWTRAEVVAKW